ncbi:MAG: hypothetical protein EAX87_14200 [Candidatus Thorarchaeota archaeon]|nr:hypothetical protein [Candidatus Thorarchaeota archaeon]
MQEPVGTLVLLVFIGTYLMISTEKVNRAAMSMVGMGLVGFVLWAAFSIDSAAGSPNPVGATFSTLVEHIEWGTILFIISMMVVVSVARNSGMFQYIALTLVRPTGGNTKRLFTVFIVFVFVISLVFDTTSTILIMGPLTIEVCKALEIDFKPFLISEAVVANFASTPSIVGAVPNLVIANRIVEEGLGVFDASILFLTMMPLAILILLVTLPLFYRFFRGKLPDSEEEVRDEVFVVSPIHMIRSRSDFYLSLIAIGILVFAFTWGQGIGLEPALVAIIVAFVALLLTRERVENILAKINWNTVFFLIGIFGLVGALGIVGFITDVGGAVNTIVENNTGTAVSFLVWVPAFLSSVIDNIPVSVVLAPIAAQLAMTTPIYPAILIFAVNVGGYVLPIGAPANILAMALAEEEHDRISFKDFAKIATPLALLHLLMATGWFFLLSFVI